MKAATLAKIFSIGQPAPAPLRRDELILQFLPLVRRIAQRAYRRELRAGARFISLEDITGELTLNLVLLVDRWNKDREDSAPIEAYLAKHLGEWRVVDATEKSQMLRDSQPSFTSGAGRELICSVDRPRSLDNGYSSRGRRRGEDGNMTPIPLHQHSNDALDVDALLSQLGTADRAIMETYLAMLAEAQITGASDKVSQAEVAAEMGVNQARVSRVINKLRILMHKNPHLG